MTLKKISLFAALLSVLVFSSALGAQKEKVALFRALVKEIERLDSTTLTLRANRPEPWAETVEKLEQQLATAKDDKDVARVFNRLNLTYPNLHSYNELGSELEKTATRRMRPAIGFDIEWISTNKTRFRIVRVDGSVPEDGEIRPRASDELIAINGRSMQEWTREGFIYCKFPLKGQCDIDFASQFFNELLSWDRSQPLRYTLKRDDRIWTTNVAVVEAPPRPPKDPRLHECAQDPRRYPGFNLAYAGNRACVYQSESDSSVAVLRITSFQYRLLRTEQPIRSVNQEVEALLPWWKKHATWSHLVIDVIDNGGGNSPIPYYRLLLLEPFQEQYVQFRKGPELADARLRMNDNGLFWGVQGQEIWFQRMLKEGVWDKTPVGQFLPHIPQFCANEEQDCSEGLIRPFEHPFGGRISVLLNQFCVSSCDGFVWQMKTKLGSRAKLFGQPQAADPAYSRLTIHAYLDANAPHGFKLEISPIREQTDPRPWISQTVYVTRSVSEDGQILDGKPLALDGFVPYTLENSSHWAQAALSAALQSP